MVCQNHLKPLATIPRAVISAETLGLGPHFFPYGRQCVGFGMPASKGLVTITRKSRCQKAAQFSEECVLRIIREPTWEDGWQKLQHGPALPPTIQATPGHDLTSPGLSVLTLSAICQGSRCLKWSWGGELGHHHTLWAALLYHGVAVGRHRPFPVEVLPVCVCCLGGSSPPTSKSLSLVPGRV